MVAVELCAVPESVTLEGRIEQVAYGADTTGEQFNTTVPLKPLDGVMVRPLLIVTDAVLLPFTVSVKLPAGAPVPLNGTVSGDPGSELVTVSVPVCAPADTGANVIVTEQLAPGASVVTLHGAEME
jgi:hypothetical protein